MLEMEVSWGWVVVMVMGESVLILQCWGSRATYCYLLNKGLSS